MRKEILALIFIIMAGVIFGQVIARSVPVEELPPVITIEKIFYEGDYYLPQNELGIYVVFEEIIYLRKDNIIYNVQDTFVVVNDSVSFSWEFYFPRDTGSVQEGLFENPYKALIIHFLRAEGSWRSLYSSLSYSPIWDVSIIKALWSKELLEKLASVMMPEERVLISSELRDMKKYLESFDYETETLRAEREGKKFVYMYKDKEDPLAQNYAFLYRRIRDHKEGGKYSMSREDLIAWLDWGIKLLEI